ncbi:MAG: hypothetical protein WBG61_11855 [Desulfobacterales bacterium]|jgi:hypothetical protein
MKEKNKKLIEAKKKYHLSDIHIQMARELGMNPKMDNPSYYRSHYDLAYWTCTYG